MKLVVDGMDDLFADESHRESLDRVRHKIEPAIRDFFAMLGLGGEFHVDELRKYVGRHFPYSAPDSAGRIMRDLRQAGVLDYTVLNRRKSLYQVTSVPRKEAS